MKRSFPMVEIIRDKTDPRCLDIYKLRYDVVINQNKMKINETNIYNSDIGKIICDDHDTSDATTHFAIRNPNTGKYVSSIRTIDGNKTKLDMEKYNWFELDASIKRDGVVEYSRLVSDISVRKTNATILLYLQSVMTNQDLGICNITFMVDSKATNLMKYYKKWAICNEISNGAVKCDEYELGRKSHVMLVHMGRPHTYARIKFDTCCVIPGQLGATIMKQYDYKN